MKWTCDATGHTYTRTRQGYQAMVWRASTGEWVAMISQNNITIAHERCGRLKDAQLWCEAHLAGLHLRRISGERNA